MGLKMVQRIERIVAFVIVKERQFVVDIGAAWTVIQGGFVEINRPHIIALGGFAVGVCDDLVISFAFCVVITVQFTFFVEVYISQYVSFSIIFLVDFFILVSVCISFSVLFPINIEL